MVGKKGFTLIEMLIVIFIISVLASLITINLSDARKRGRDTRRKEDIKTISSALELYNTTNSTYPIGEYVSNGCSFNPSGSGDCTATNNPWIPEITSQYIGTLPVDPINNLTAVNQFPANNSTKFAYGYYTSTASGVSLTQGDWYLLSAMLEVSNSPDSVGATNTINPLDGTSSFTDTGWQSNGYIYVVR